jgi:flagellar basal-body rod protein FlgF
MDNTTYVALSLAKAMQRDLDVTANNIANANTSGFKSERILFTSYLHPDEGVEVGKGTNFVVDNGSFVDDSQGALTRTDNPLDVAIKGDAWMSYRNPTGQVGYGRDGQFALDQEGYLVTLSGARVLDASGGEITIPQGISEIKIAPNGTISSDETGALGQIGMFDLPDIQSYMRIGNNMFVPPNGQASAAVPAEGSVMVQGSVELSNVQPVSEVTRLMFIQKAYDRALKLMTTEDDLRRDMLRRLGTFT